MEDVSQQPREDRTQSGAGGGTGPANRLFGFFNLKTLQKPKERAGERLPTFHCLAGKTTDREKVLFYKSSYQCYEDDKLPVEK